MQTPEERVWAARQDRAGVRIRCEISLPEETRFQDLVKGSCVVDLAEYV